MSVTTLKEQIPVKNAGLVIANSYVPSLFERLGLTQHHAFINTAAQELAVHLLQYLATGMLHSAAQLLPLNKVMCGLPVMQQVLDNTEITESQRQTIEGLIQAMISYWPAIGSSSVDGFRGNWLVRDGMLTELEDRWELKVEKRPYDILLQRSPFSFSTIKYPWMDKPLRVGWAY